MVNYLDRLIKYGLYSLVFLMPIFFLPWTVSPVALNKQTLLAVFCFLILIFWLIKIIVLGKINFVWNNLSKAVLLLIIVLGVSTFFADSKINSFWGMNLESDSFLSFILYGLVFFLFANLLENKKQILKVVLIFLGSSSILAVVFLIQTFWGSIFSWEFTKVIGFNPIGSVQALAVLLGGSLSILITMVSFRPLLKNKALILSIILGILFFIPLLLIDYYVVWLMIAFSMTLVVFVLLKNIDNTRIFIFPLVILILSLILVFIQSPTKNFISMPFEVNLTYGASVNIAQETISESTKNFIIGSGPATFAFDYDLYRSAGPNMTDFWNVRFAQGTSVFPTLLATSGALGLLAILFLIFAFLFQGFKVLTKLESDNKNDFVRAITLIGGFCFLVSWFFYSINFSLFFISFLMFGLFVNSSDELSDKKKSEFLFTKSPQKAFFIMLISVFLIVGSVVGIYKIGQKYVGALAFAEGLDLVNREEPNLDQGILSLNRAVKLDQNDNYFRNLSQVFIFKINGILNNEEISQEERSKMFQQIVNSIEYSATTASQINPSNSQNWLQLGKIYENLINLGVENAEGLAVSNYKKAIELAPQNPELSFSLGRTYKIVSEKLQYQLNQGQMSKEQIDAIQSSLDEIIQLSIDTLKKTIQLKPDFTPAYYLLAQVYEAQGEIDLALGGYEIVLKLEPGNKEVIEKIESLR